MNRFLWIALIALSACAPVNVDGCIRYYPVCDSGYGPVPPVDHFPWLPK